MRATTPNRSLGVSPIPSRTPGAVSPAPAYPSSSQMRYPPQSGQRGTPIQNIPLRSSDGSGFDAAPSSAAPMPQSSHADMIFPMNLDLSERLLAGAASNGAASISSVNLGKEQLHQLQVEATEYIDNLDLTLRTMFANDNSRLRQTIVNTSDMPLTFLFFRLHQQMLKLSGDYNGQREREALHRLATLLDA
jgi:hypothetical protein